MADALSTKVVVTFLLLSGQPVPTVIATKTGGTGVLNFDSGPEFLTISSTGTPEAINVDVTVILPRELNERNFMLAATVPGESQVILHFDDALSVPSLQSNIL